MSEPPGGASERFQPRASRAMARMFDDVSGRYDLLNRLMTLGQDRVWRAAMWRGVPEGARRVLDLCTGNGVSLPGLARPGRLVVGVDVSLGMLESAAERLPAGGWAPRLACADAFHLPFRGGTLDAVTVAFGVRNLRPHGQALAEIRRVLAAGGVLSVLEAAAPERGLPGALHAFHLRRVVPWLGRLSPDPSAYAYLSASIFEFGAGAEFERALADAGFSIATRRRFLFGATRLWVAAAPGAAWAASDKSPTGAGQSLQDARPAPARIGHLAQPRAALEGEWRVWTAGQAVLSLALSLALVWGLVAYAKWSAGLPLESWQRVGLWLLLGLGTLGFSARTVMLVQRLRGPRPGR